MNPVIAVHLLAAAAEGGKRQGGGWDVMILMILPIAALFWWMSRSQKKREQQRKDMLTALKKGDKIVTVGGIHGEITRLSDREAVIMVDKAKGIELRFQRTAIASTPGSAGSGGEPVKLGEEGGSKS